MNETEWKEIPGRLQRTGFAVSYNRVCFDPDGPLWCAKAIRGGKEWSTLGKTLKIAFLELEKQTQDIVEDWRNVLTH